MSAAQESRPLISELPASKPKDSGPSGPDMSYLMLRMSAEIAPVLPDITLWPKPLVRSSHAISYQGWDRRHRRRVVVKVQQAAGESVMARRFGHEGAVLLRLRHPSIVTLYAFHSGNAVKNSPALVVLEHVPGTTLAALVAAGGRLAPERAILIIEQIAAALDCVHALGVVHRDIQPSSIRLPRHGPAKLTDFGLARLSDELPLMVTGSVLGTAEYASPEQVQGSEAADALSDVYSLAAVTYFALIGTPPFRAANASTQSQLSVMHRQLFSSPPPLRLHRPDFSPAIEEAVLRGLAKEPDARYASAGQFAAALRAALAASAGQPQQKAMDASARRIGALTGAIAAAVLLAGFALWAWNGGAFKPPVTALASATSAAPANATPDQAPVKTAPVKTAPVKTAPIIARQLVIRFTPPPKPRLPQAALFKLAPAKRLPRMAARVTAPMPYVLPLVNMNAAEKTKTAAGAPAVAARAGWYTLSGWIKLPSRSSQKPELAHALPLWVKVDGHPLPQLASGQWTILPVGQHRVTFQPAAGVGAGLKTWTIKIAPSAHLSQQVLLPPAPLPDIPTHLRNP